MKLYFLELKECLPGFSVIVRAETIAQAVAFAGERFVEASAHRESAPEIADYDISIIEDKGDPGVLHQIEGS